MFKETIRLMEKQRKNGVYSGYTTSFIQGQQVNRITKGFAATLPEVERLSQSYLFDLASLTKVILTTTILFRLMDQQKIQLNDPVKRYLPELIDDKVTIKELMTHTSGIETWIENREKLSYDELRKAYYSQVSGNDRGKVVKYTDTGFILLGFMIETIYQQPFSEVAQKEVLDSLGMTHSFFHHVPSHMKVVPTQKIEENLILRGIVHDAKARILETHAGHAGLFSSIEDVERFVQMYLKNEGTYLSQKIIAEAQKNQTDQMGEERGLGWKLLKKNTQTYLFHTGYTGTFLFMDIKKKMGWLFFSNRVHPYDHRKEYLRSREELLTCFLKEYDE